jgi:DNA-binding PucR family transcriptional regulator
VTDISVRALAKAAPDVATREQLASLQGLLVLSMLMTDSGDERRVLELAASSAPSFGNCRLHAVFLLDDGWERTSHACSRPESRADLEAQFVQLGGAGGAVEVPGEGWASAYPLRSLGGHFGYLVVGADREPTPGDQFLLRVLAQQTGIALANAKLHERDQATAATLRDTNAALAETVTALERSTAIHERLTRVAASGEGEEGIARAVHDLTGYPVAIEDRYGNLRAWAGPACPDPYSKQPEARRRRTVERALRSGQPIRESGRLLVATQPRDDSLGVLALIDPNDTAGEQEHIALEHGATVLAVELARLRSVADTELRLGRDLVDELLSGTNQENAVARAEAIGYDLNRPHRVVVVETSDLKPYDDAFFQAVRRAARATGIGPHPVARFGAVVMLSTAEQDCERFRAAVLEEVGGMPCRVGVGSICTQAGDFPRSLHHARLALRVQRASGSVDRTTVFDDLGIYQILGESEETLGIERFARQWLGALLDYDERKGSTLVATLSRYLECGKSHAATAAALSLHRNTLKYRVRRIRQISGHDLSNPDTVFNLQLATRAWHTLEALRAESGPVPATSS